MQNKRTKQCKKIIIWFSIIHFLCLFGPFLYYIPYAFIIGKTIEKLTLSFMIILVLCLSFLAIIVDAKNRAGFAKTTMWLLIIGIISCLKKVETFIYIMAIISIIDEFFIIKFIKKYKISYEANKEIDRRD